MLGTRQRSRTGCLTCKQRRVRCDEEHPACKRCTSTGRHCDGYPNPPAMKKVKCLPMVMMVVTEFERATYDPTINIHLQYFFHISAPALRNHRSAAFWNNTVLQVCQQVPWVRHLAVAVASLERFLRTHTDFPIMSPDESEVHMVHYGRGLKYMSNDQDVGLVLIGCLMLVLLEDLRKAPFAALVHVRAGLQLLEDDHYGHMSNSLFDELRVVFRTLSEHQSELAADYIRIDSVYKCSPDQRLNSSDLDLGAKDPTRGFASLEHASNTLGSLRKYCVNPQPDFRPLSRFNTIPGLTEELNTWLEEFNMFQSRLDHQQQEFDKCEIHTLRAYHLVLKIASCATAQNNETWYNYHDQDFDGLIQKFAIMSELGRINLSTLLFFVACKYRNVAGRRRAIELLSYRVNGWEGTFLADVAEKIVQQEEEGLENPVTSADIPESSRVRPIVVIPVHRQSNQTALCIHHAPFTSFARCATVYLSAWSDGIDIASKNVVLQSAIDLVYSVEPGCMSASHMPPLVPNPLFWCL